MLLTSLAFAAFAAVSFPQAEAVVRAQLGKELEARVEETVPDFWGAVLVAPAGEIALARGYGLEKTGDQRKGADHYFDVGSVSKTYTAVTLLRLAQEQQLTLDDPLAKWIPKAPADKAAITLRQLLQHASGFGRKAADYTVRDYGARDGVLAAILAQPLAHAPGSEFEYSNVNYTLLAGVIELAGKKPFDEQVARVIFAPLELENTSFAGWTGRKLDRQRGTERVDGKLRGHVLDYPWGWGKRGITNVVTSVFDLVRFAQALRTDELLAPAQRELLFQPGPGPYTCGLELFTGPAGRRFFGHRGATNGYGAIFWLDPADGTTIVVLTRKQDTAETLCTALAAALAEPQPVNGEKR